jgi:thiol-disulfide isomerase/thioredoxin
MDGKAVNFPADFKGRVVLVDFWATWCGPCRRELPNVLQAYNSFHDKGFDIIGVTLDELQRVPATTVSRFTEQQHLPWAQVYEGAKLIADQYGVTGIPAAFLVDGDTGAILREGDAATGAALIDALRARLGKRS